MRWRGTCLICGVICARSVLLAAASLALFFAGCSTAPKAVQKNAGDGKLFAVTADSAAFFHHGPRPGRDPDAKLPKDTLVKLVRPSFGYSKVQVVATGQQGYVLSEEIKPASPLLVAALSARPADSVATTPSDRAAAEQFNLNSNDPRLVPPPEELPNPDLPPLPRPDQ